MGRQVSYEQWKSMGTDCDDFLSAFPYPGYQLLQHASWLNLTLTKILRQQ